MSSTQSEPHKKRKLSTDDEHINVKRNKVNVKINFPLQQNEKDQIAIDEQPEETILPGTPVNRRKFRRVGPYILGPKLGHSAVESISQYLAKKRNSEEFVHLKILHLLTEDERNQAAVNNECQAKMLLHTEFSLLSLLQNESGVIRNHGMFSDMAYEEETSVTSAVSLYTGKIRKRLVLALDCVSSHEYSKKSNALINLQQYLTAEKRLPEIKALQIFYEIVSVVETLHKRNVVHRDLKLGNIVLNKSCNKIILTNFCLGKYLIREDEKLHDQRGSPAYISPEVLRGVPYEGKPSDVWALGVILFMMFYGRFPFYESTPAALFRKIKAADYTIPTNSDISAASQNLISNILVLKVDFRLTATQVREKIEVILLGRPQMRHLDQLVPSLVNEEINKSKSKSVVHSRRHIVYNSNSDQIVPHAESQTSISSLTKNCSVPLTPIAQSFLRPSVSTESNRTNIRSITQSEIGQVQFIIFNNATRNSETNSSDGSSNWQATIRFHNNASNSHSQLVTQQMRNLSLRNGRDLGVRGISWREIRSNGSGSEWPTNIRPSLPSALNQLSVDTIQLNLVNRMFCMSDDETVTHSSQLVPNSSGSNQRYQSIPSRESLERIAQTINRTFIRGRRLQPSQPFTEFDGTITQDLATKICLWFNTHYREHPVIRRVFNDNCDNAIGKVHEFLNRCGVQTLTVEGLIKVKPDQPFELLLVMIYLLQASGYTHSYLLS